MILVSKIRKQSRTEKSEDEDYLEHKDLHGKVLADTVAGASREGVEREILDWREGRFLGDPSFREEVVGLREVVRIVVQL